MNLEAVVTKADELFNGAQAFFQENHCIEPTLFTIDVGGAMTPIGITEIGHEFDYETIYRLMKDLTKNAKGMILVTNVMLKDVGNPDERIESNDPEADRALVVVIHVPTGSMFRQAIYIRDGNSYRWCDEGWKRIDVENSFFSSPYL